MSQSYRIRTELGINKTVNVQLGQEFDFLEVLSLKLQQGDIYNRACADYGVIVGRVTANGGFGVPNARISVFIPILPIDQSNPLITSIYPYKSPSDKNEDGYRYNLLPYEKSYSVHAATGTLPTRIDVLTGNTTIDIFDRYYKYTSKTNDSGDYMIMGVPLGAQTLVMDVDLSDIGEFSLTPQDLIRMGKATESQVAGNRFNTSTDLNSLPQIVSLIKMVDISPLWGDPTLCDISVNRVDFDLRNDANINIEPTSIFMGSIFSTSDKFRVRKNCKPKDNMGNLCGLTSGPGQILALRQTIAQDNEGNPGLEVYQLEQAGNVIDGDGTWITELPMNLEYLITNEFGEKIISNDPSIGIPTKGKYRFKIKWQQSNDSTEQTRRPHFLVPNVKEYGWSDSSSNPTNSTNPTVIKQQQSSYYFGLAWSGYTNGFTGTQKNKKLNEAIDGTDTFYEFQFNRVYTIASLIDEYKKGAKGRFIGIKEIDSDDCDSTVNKFPVNDGVRNFDFLFFLFSILMTLLQPLALSLLFIANILLWLYDILISFACWIRRINIFGIKPFKNAFPGVKCNKIKEGMGLPMIIYPDCEACSCKQSDEVSSNNDIPTGGGGYLVELSESYGYVDGLRSLFLISSSPSPAEAIGPYSELYAVSLSGRDGVDDGYGSNSYKLPYSNRVDIPEITGKRRTRSIDLPLGERINLFNQRDNYFKGLNKIKVTFAVDSNLGKFHYDNTLTVLSNDMYEAGDVLTFVNPATTSDINWRYTATTQTGIITGISGTTYNGSGATTVNVAYATEQYTNSLVNYSLPSGSTETNYKYPQDREYYQVITAMTISQASLIWNSSKLQSFPNIISGVTTVNEYVGVGGFFIEKYSLQVRPMSLFDDNQNKVVLILQRGVDPYSPKYVNKYNIGNIFGESDTNDNFTFTASTRLNIPIQKLVNPNLSVQAFSQDEIFYQSYFFSPGILNNTTPGYQYSGYTSNSVGYYGKADALNPMANTNSISNKGIRTIGSNDFYDSSSNSSKYDFSEDLSSMGYMFTNGNNLFNYQYSSPILKESTMLINSSNMNIMRTDRLPTSDYLENSINVSLSPILQQNNNFVIYLINTDAEDIADVSFTTGASIVTPDIEGLPNSLTVMESFGCEGMVQLKCYTGFGSQFTVDQNCVNTDSVVNGCYLFLRRLSGLNLAKNLKTDLTNFTEWAYRFRFFYGLCRGVLSQTFVNNWINGSLYMFPIQVNKKYNKQNKLKSLNFCGHLSYFDNSTNNFYYRSSPYNIGNDKFIGFKTGVSGAVNTLNLLFPTTVVNLGIKDSFYSEIVFDPSTKGYIIPNIESSSYGDTSDIVNLFVISRITDDSFLKKLITIGDNGIGQLFSREDKRIDGDLAQMMSINSEIGNINFSPEYYDIIPGDVNPPVNILGTATNPTIAIWFSSTTENLQTKDYLTPGRINFRTDDNSNYYPYPYGIKSQIVPFYQWKLDNNSSTIFGTQKNTWLTDAGGIVQNKPYQSQDRTSTIIPGYFTTTNIGISDLNNRGYIFNMDSNGTYVSTGMRSKSFVVGAPFHFYFGTIKGLSALDKFKTKYSVSE